MHLTDHISDAQLNEYLDNETDERAVIERHLSSCDECAARMTALQALFAEIESLPELELTRNVAARFDPTPNPIPQLPRWLTLTAALQVVIAVIAMVAAVPFATQLSSQVSVPSFAEIYLVLQVEFVLWVQSFQTITLPEVPSNVLTLPIGISPAILGMSVTALFLVWMFGNWWLLQRKSNPFA